MVDSETTVGLSNVNISVVNFQTRTQAATALPATTARVTTRRTKASKPRRDLGELEEVAPEQLLDRHARSASLTTAVTAQDGSFTVVLSADPRSLSFVVNMGNNRVSQFDLQIFDGMGPSISIVIGATVITLRDEWRVVTAWIGDGLPQHNNFDARMVTPLGCVVGPLNPGCVDPDGGMAQLNADFAANSTIHRGTGPESIDISGTQVSQLRPHPVAFCF